MVRCLYPRFVRPRPTDDNPFPTGLEVPCGTCYACRLKKTDMWIDRLEMEQRCHDTPPIFLTITYANESLFLHPDTGVPSVNLRHLQLFFKSLRQHYRDCKLRYIYLGEYGGRTARPHYHAILFGCPSVDLRTFQSTCERFWNRGHVRCSRVNSRRLAYVASFHIHADYYPPGSSRPFCQYSRNPGLGNGYTRRSELARPHIPIGGDLSTLTANSLRYVRFSGKVRPLPPYIRKIFLPVPYADLPVDQPQPFAVWLKEISSYQDSAQVVENLRSYYKLLHKRSIEKHGKYIQSLS